MPREDRLPVIKQPVPGRRSSRKLLIFLFVFFITLLVVLFFQSSLSQVSGVEIEGQQLVAEEEIRQAAAIRPGDHFFSVSSSKVSEQVKALKMIEDVTVTKHFPGVIHIQIKEFGKVAYQIGDNGQTEALLADGSAVPITVQGVALDKPILSGWSSGDPLKVKLCKTMASLDPAFFTDISEIKPAPSDSYPDKIKMYTRSQYEVQTTIGYLPNKIGHLASYIASLQQNKVYGGVIRMLEADTHSQSDDTPKTVSPTDGSKAPAGAGSSKDPGAKPNGSAKTPGNG